MNYKKIYDSIISRAKSRVLLEGIYTENHHIIPRCMSGSDESWNRVDLLAREHCLVHLLLVKIYPGVKGLVYASWRMYHQLRHSGGHYSCRIYEELRKKVSEFKSEEMKKIWKDPVYRSHFENRVSSLETRKKISLSLKGKPHSKDHVQKVADKNRGRHNTEETIKRIRTKLIGRPMSDFVKKNFLEVIRSEKYRLNFLEGMKKKMNSPLYDEYKQRLSNIHKGHKDSLETKKKKSEAQKLRRQKQKEIKLKEFI